MQTDVGMFFNIINDIQPEGCLSRYFWMNAHICIKNICFEIQLTQVGPVLRRGVISLTLCEDQVHQRNIIMLVITLIIFTQLNSTLQSGCLGLIRD